MGTRKESLVCWILAIAAAGACALLGGLAQNEIIRGTIMFPAMKVDLPVWTEFLVKLGPTGVGTVYAVLIALILGKELLLRNMVLRVGLTSLFWLLGITLLEVVRSAMASPFTALLKNLKT